MTKIITFVMLLLLGLFLGCKNEQSADKQAQEFPAELVDFTLLKKDSVFSGTGKDTWDKLIRERGFIIKEGNDWKLYYSGYNLDTSNVKYLGLAVSNDGINWKRYSSRPIFSEDWVEDMYVTKYNGKYYMFAEGRNDIPHWLTSPDGIQWHNEGNLKIYKADGKTLVEGVVGTPTVWIEKGTWYLFYEKGDLGIWAAKSADGKEWRNVSDDPVIAMGPELYDKYAVAADCIVKKNGRYYLYYHASAQSPWEVWTVNVAMSKDLIHWKKYGKNPILGPDRSSPVVLPVGSKYRLYTMHPVVYVYESK